MILPATVDYNRLLPSEQDADNRGDTTIPTGGRFDRKTQLIDLSARVARKFETGEKNSRGTHVVNANRAISVGTFTDTKTTSTGTLKILGSWEGAVLQKNGDMFVARLVDTKGKHSDEEAEFSVEEVPKSDRDLIDSGAVFYWTVGFWDSIGGLRSRISQIRFRRLPVWSPAELERAKANASRLGQLFE